MQKPGERPAPAVLTSAADHPLVVFVSYAHEDENFLIRLRAFLKPLEGRRSTANARRVEVFDDTAIRPGAAWRMELEHEVERADVAILLVSQYLVASDFVREYEIPWILSQSQTRDLLVVCVPVGTAFGYPKELDEFQWVGDPERPMEALVPYEQNTIWKQVAETVAERAQADHPAAGSRGRQTVNEPEIPSIPHEVPAVVPDFTNRTGDLAKLRAALDESQTLLGIVGYPGSGKSELARRFTGEIETLYPDGQVYIDLKGVTATPLHPRDVLAELIERFSSKASLPDRTDDLSKRFRSVFYGKRVLFFMDDAASAEQLSPLIPPAGCLLLTTARPILNLPGMFLHELRLFSDADSEELLIKIEPRIGKHAEQIASLCGFLPFALRTAANTLRGRRDIDPAAYAQELSANRARRSGLIEPVLATSYELLTPVERKQQWCALSCFAAPFSREAIERIWDLPEEECDATLGSLLSSNLVQYEDHRYALHDLARLFAQSHLSPGQPYARRHAVYFLRQLTPERRHPLASLDEIASEIFAAHRHCRQQQIQSAAGSVVEVIAGLLKADLAEATRTAYLVARLFKRKRHFGEAMSLYTECHAAAVTAKQVALEGACLRSIGEIHWAQGQTMLGLDYCRNAIRRLSQESDYASRKELIFTLHLYSEQCFHAGSFEESESAARESLRIRDLIPIAARERMAGLSNGSIKMMAFLLRNRELDGAAEVLKQERDNLVGIDVASTLGQLGCAMSDAGRFSEAETLMLDSLGEYKAASLPLGSSWMLRRLGKLDMARKDNAKAAARFEESVRLATEQKLQPHHAAAAVIDAIRFCCDSRQDGGVQALTSQLEGLLQMLSESDRSARRRVLPGLRSLLQSLEERGWTTEARRVRSHLDKLSSAEEPQESPDWRYESMPDIDGCDALSLAWPGELARELLAQPGEAARAHE